MELLFVASECAPFVKTGGLADVVGAVPKALQNLGASVRVLLPAYPALAPQLQSGNTVMEIASLHGGRAKVVSIKAQGLELLLLDAPHLYDRPGSIYLDANGVDWHDNALRFGALCLAGSAITLQGLREADGSTWTPDLVHCHDWQAGLLPLYLRQSGSASPPVVMTIHNIAFQGLFDTSQMAPLGIEPSYYNPEGIEYYDQLGFS